MEWITANNEWIYMNAPMLALGTLVFIQWVALQAFFVHYTLFRESLKRPRPDQTRIIALEKTIAFQAEQLELVFSKLAEHHREMSKMNLREPSPRERNALSLESTFVSMGEMSLKKRIQEMKSETPSGSMN